MKIISLIALLGALVSFLRLPAFEVTWVVLLISPVVAYLFGYLFGPSLLVNWFCFAGVIGIVVIFSVLTRRRRSLSPLPEALFVSLAGAIAILLCAYQWPDFIAMGERLRDYALLSSVVASPLVPQEPWLSGTTLNYYLYWYRFGAFYGSLVGLPVWELYHVLQAITGALLLGTTYAFCRSVGRASKLVALAGALFVSAGSNIQGVINFVTHDTNWWGPSRVIPGAINEFPAWSLLLGDLHPHFLNLGLVPFAALLALRLSGSPLLYLLLAALTLPWVYAANAWELPTTLIMMSVAIVVLLLCSDWRQLVASMRRDVLNRRGTVMILSALVLGVSLFLSSRNIVPAEAPLRLVGDPIVASPLGAFLLHWGAGIMLGAASLLRLIGYQGPRYMPFLALLAALAASHPLPLLIVLGGLGGWYIWSERSRVGSECIVGIALFCAALVMIALPEIVFFDDPYGGENERMNTIFKFYSAAWWPLHSGALLLALGAARTLSSTLRRALLLPGILMTLAFLGFFYQTVSLRRTEPPRTAEGLTSIDRHFAGARAIIEYLRTQPRAVLIEAEGGAYDYTAHVATLGGMESFLGWANHVNLLSRTYAEVSRREALIRSFYGSISCAERRELMAREGISYAVMGPLERQRYPGSQQADLSCLPVVIQAGEYVLYGRG